MQGFFKFLIVSGVGLGGVLDGRYTDTNFEHHANISKKIDRINLRPDVLSIEHAIKFAVHYTKLLRKNGQWGGKEGGYLIS